MLIVAWIVFGVIPGFLACTLAAVTGRLAIWQPQPSHELYRPVCETHDYGNLGQ